MQFRNYQKLKPQNPSFIKPHHVSPLGFMFSCCSPGLMREHGVITKIGGAMLYHNEVNLFLKSHFLRLFPTYHPKPLIFNRTQTCKLSFGRRLSHKTRPQFFF